MQRIGRRQQFLAVLVCAWVGIGMACGANAGPAPEPVAKEAPAESQDPETVHPVDLEPTLLEGLAAFEQEREHPVLQKVVAQRGQGIRFAAKGLTAWVVIPDGNLQPGSGGEDWSVTDSYIAFRVSDGSKATVVVPARYPPSETDTVLHYSILVYDGSAWEYVHGSSPPRIIIPTRP